MEHFNDLLIGGKTMFRNLNNKSFWTYYWLRWLIMPWKAFLR